jgi:hypothetical protein
MNWFLRQRIRIKDMFCFKMRNSRDFYAIAYKNPGHVTIVKEKNQRFQAFSMHFQCKEVRCSKCKNRVKKLSLLFYTWLDRARRADHEYHLLNLFWSSFGWENLDIRKTSEKVNFWPMWRKYKFSPVYIELNSSQLFYSDSVSKSEYIHIS